MDRFVLVPKKGVGQLLGMLRNDKKFFASPYVISEKCFHKNVLFMSQCNSTDCTQV